MIIYLIYFFISFVLLAVSKKFEKNKKLSIFFQVLSIIVLCILASVRDVTIGTDVKTYVHPVFRICSNYDCSMLDIYGYHMESGYYFLNYFISIFTQKLYILLFIIQFFVLCFSFFGIKRMYKKNYLYVYFLFIVLFYNMTLNIVRQFMALALCLYALGALIENKDKKFFLFVFLAFLFHSSAILFLGIYLLYKIIKKNPKNLFKLIIFSVICFSLGTILYFLFPNILENINFLAKYKFYLTNYVNATLEFNTMATILDLTFILLYIMFYKIYDRKSELSRFYFALLLIDFVCLLIATKYTIVYRLGLYFRIPAILFFLANCDFIFSNKNRKNNNLIYRLISVIFVLLYWYYVYVIGNSGQTVPFKISEEIKYKSDFIINLLETEGELNENSNFNKYNDSL